jgi:hypothetical protein
MDKAIAAATGERRHGHVLVRLLADRARHVTISLVLLHLHEVMVDGGQPPDTSGCDPWAVAVIDQLHAERRDLRLSSVAARRTSILAQWPAEFGDLPRTLRPEERDIKTFTVRSRETDSPPAEAAVRAIHSRYRLPPPGKHSRFVVVDLTKAPTDLLDLLLRLVYARDADSTRRTNAP